MAKTPCTQSTRHALRPIHRQGRRAGGRARDRGGDRQQPWSRFGRRRPVVWRRRKHRRLRSRSTESVHQRRQPGEIGCQTTALHASTRPGRRRSRRGENVTSRLRARETQYVVATDRKNRQEATRLRRLADLDRARPSATETGTQPCARRGRGLRAPRARTRRHPCQDARIRRTGHAAVTQSITTQAVSPLGTPEQRDAEQDGHRNRQHAAGSVDEAGSQGGLVCHRAERIRRGRRPDKENLAQLSRSVDEYAMGAAFQQQLLDPMTPRAVMQVAPPHTWYGQTVGGSRILYDNPDTIYRFMAVNKTSTYVIRGKFEDWDPEDPEATQAARRHDLQPVDRIVGKHRGGPEPGRPRRQRRRHVRDPRLRRPATGRLRGQLHAADVGLDLDRGARHVVGLEHSATDDICRSSASAARPNSLLAQLGMLRHPTHRACGVRQSHPDAAGVIDSAAARPAAAAAGRGDSR